MRVEQVSFLSRDGVRLGGHVFRAETEQAALLISGGTGFPSRYYRHFAEMAALHGFTSLTFDYRGGPLSPASGEAFAEIQYADWGRHDMPAALGVLQEHVQDRPVFHVGHSVGGHFAGLMDNVAQIDAHAFVCVGSGYWPLHQAWYRPMALWFWHAYGNYSLARHGCVRPGGGWTGGVLPPEVFRQWRRWCHRPDYYFSDWDSVLAPHFFADVTAPIASFTYVDDPIATPKAARAMLAAYPNAPVEMMPGAAADFGLRRIGHNGPFGKTVLPAATPIFNWLQKQMQGAR